MIFLANVIPYARSKPFWHDEIYTILLSRLPSMSDTWSASMAGADLSPPLNMWLTRGVHLVAPVGPVSTRIPPIAGFYLAMLLVFVVVRRRAGTVAAVTGALLLFFTAGFRYAAEARPYGVMIGLAATVLYAWMEVAAGRRRSVHLALLLVALGASLWNHYFGALVFVPVVAGELARTVRHRRWDAGVSVVIVLAMVAALPLTRLIQIVAEHRSGYWAKPPGIAFVLESYQFLLAPLRDPAFIVVALVIVVAAFVRIRTPELARSVPAHEGVALTVCVLLPFVAFAIGRTAGIPIVPRYLLCAVPGFVIAMALAMWRVNRRRSGIEAAACASLIVLTMHSALRPDRPRFQDPVAQRPLLLDSLRTPSPTVVSGGVQFLQLWYYAPADAKTRMYYLADPVAALGWSGSDTVDRGFLALLHWTAVPVHPFADFVATHRSFRVYDTDFGWLLRRLEDRGAVIEEVAHEPGATLYQVTLEQLPQ